jgi:hypothetical protein
MFVGNVSVPLAELSAMARERSLWSRFNAGFDFGFVDAGNSAGNHLETAVSGQADSGFGATAFKSSQSNARDAALGLGTTSGISSATAARQHDPGFQNNDRARSPQTTIGGGGGRYCFARPRSIWGRGGPPDK